MRHLLASGMITSTLEALKHIIYVKGNNFQDGMSNFTTYFTKHAMITFPRWD